MEEINYDPEIISAVDTDVGLEVFYTGTDNDFASVTVADATGDITLKHGSASPGSVDNTLGLPVADETTGILDVSDAEANTVLEVLDYVNRVERNWVMRPMAMRRADLMTNTLNTLAATQCNLAPVQLLRDSGVVVQTNTYTLGARITNGSLDGMHGDEGIINCLHQINGKITSVAATGTGYNDGEGALTGLYCIVYAINDKEKSQRRLWWKALTSGTAFVFNHDDWGGDGLCGKPGEALLVLIQNSGTGPNECIPTDPLEIYASRRIYGGGREMKWHMSDQ